MSMLLAVVAPGMQGVATLADELCFHKRRGLPRWERIGHPLDTLTVLTCYALALSLPPTAGSLHIYVVAAVFSCLFVTKDEFVHARQCDPLEHWLHAVLFVLHPIVLASIAFLWLHGARTQIAALAALTLAFCLYQAFYWNTPWMKPSSAR